MKADIHPQYNELTLQFPKGDSIKTFSTYGKDKIMLDVDFRDHPAWTKKGIAKVNESSTMVTKFNQKFGNFDFSTPKKS